MMLGINQIYQLVTWLQPNLLSKIQTIYFVDKMRYKKNLQKQLNQCRKKFLYWLNHNELNLVSQSNLTLTFHYIKKLQNPYKHIFWKTTTKYKLLDSLMKHTQHKNNTFLEQWNHTRTRKQYNEK